MVASLPSDRALIASVAAYSRWARRTSAQERADALAPARDGMRGKWETQADPDGVLPPDELAAAVDRLRSAHYRRMALRSAQVRRARATSSPRRGPEHSH